MKVFVTGATGLVGSFVLKELLTLGHQPRILVREGASTKLVEQELHRCETAQGDILDYLSLVKAMEGCDMVIHCAGKVSFDTRKTKEIFNVNVVGTTNVVNACLSTQISKLIHVSSIAALGRQPNAVKINEHTQWDESGHNSFYAKTKYLAELEVFRGGEEGLSFSMVNPSVILGPGDPGRSSARLFSFVKKMPWFFPDGYLNVVDVRDVAKAIGALIHLDHPQRLILNAQNIHYKELYGMIAETYGINVRQYKLPMPLIRTIAFFDSLRTMLKGGEPLVTKETLRHLKKRYEYTSLYYPKLFPQPLIQAKESIAWTVASMKNFEETLLNSRS